MPGEAEVQTFMVPSGRVLMFAAEIAVENAGRVCSLERVGTRRPMRIGSVDGEVLPDRSAARALPTDAGDAVAARARRYQLGERGAVDELHDEGEGAACRDGVELP